MKLAWILWLSSLLPQPTADQICLATTIYLEARDQSPLGQRAVAEVALRRHETRRWGDSVCEVVTAPRQFAPTLVHPEYRLRNLRAWNRSVAVAVEAVSDWTRPVDQRREVVPGADHFVALEKANPAWSRRDPVAKIGDHTFYRILGSL